MSKKKNTLKDLDEFLKQQATTFVSPPTIQDKLEDTSPVPQAGATPSRGESSMEEIADQLKTLSSLDPAFRKKFYDLIIQSLESLQASLPEDKMLINTALYLKSGSQWKEVIIEYWKAKSLS